MRYSGCKMNLDSKNLPKIIDRKIRVGLVGCGRISKNHFEALSYFSDDFELVAVCDSNERCFGMRHLNISFWVLYF